MYIIYIYMCALGVYICVYLCVYIYICACSHWFVYVDVNVSSDMCIYVCIYYVLYTYMDMCVYVSMHIRVYFRFEAHGFLVVYTS